MNYKSIGEIGENCVIGELSKYGLNIATLLSDNLPYDLIAIAKDKLFKVQVKTSTENKNNEYISFSIRTNNWHKGTEKKYNREDCDVVALYDLTTHKCFLLLPEEFENKSNFTIRYQKPKTNNGYGIKWFEDYIISNKRIKEVFDFEVPDFNVYFCNKIKKYQRICVECGKSFEGNYKNAKHCSSICRSMQRRKVKRPSKEELKILIDTTSFLQIGRKYKVSDNAVRKWAKSYELI